MKTSKGIIISFIDKAVIDFRDTQYRYEFDVDSQSHFIEVTPSEFLLTDKKFALHQFEFVDNFINEFPGESICFITNNDLHKICNPIYTAGSPKAIFDSIASEILNNLLLTFEIDFSDISKNFFQGKLFKFDFSLDSKIYIPSIKIHKHLKNYKQKPRLKSLSRSKNRSRVENSFTVVDEPKKEIVGESNYALAA